MNVDTGAFKAITAERDDLADSNVVLTETIRELIHALPGYRPPGRHAARGKLRLIQGGAR